MRSRPRAGSVPSGSRVVSAPTAFSVPRSRGSRQRSGRVVQDRSHRVRPGPPIETDGTDDSVNGLSPGRARWRSIVTREVPEFAASHRWRALTCTVARPDRAWPGVPQARLRGAIRSRSRLWPTEANSTRRLGVVTLARGLDDRALSPLPVHDPVADRETRVVPRRSRSALAGDERRSRVRTRCAPACRPRPRAMHASWCRFRRGRCPERLAPVPRGSR